MHKIISKFDVSLEFLENIIIVVTLSIMVLLAFLQVVLRNFFDTGILWGDILLRHLVLWVGFFGASLATRQEKHINVDILTKLLPERFVPFVKLTVNIFALIINIILAKASWVFLSFEIEAGTTLFLDIPSWYIQIVLPLGFGLIGFRFFLKIVEQITGFFTGPEEAEKEQ
jgi:TRAP-type C4-dicarboxylate transport system permease small subunit